jgi:hypothetical protein
VWEPLPTDDRDWAVEAAMSVPGARAGYHLLDPKTGNGLSIFFFEDEQAVAAADVAVEKRAHKIGWHDEQRPGPASVTVYQVLRATEA